MKVYTVCVYMSAVFDIFADLEKFPIIDYGYGVNMHLNLLIGRPFQSDGLVSGWTYFLNQGGEYITYYIRLRINRRVEHLICVKALFSFPIQ